MKCPSCGSSLIVKLMKDAGVPAQPKKEFEDAGDIGELLDMIDDARLKGSALDFVTQTRQRFKQYGPKTLMSEKQLAWLHSLANPSEDEF